MTNTQKWIVGLGIILAALGGYAAATFDGDPSTNQSVGETIDKVKDGIGVIRSGDSATSNPVEIK